MSPDWTICVGFGEQDFLNTVFRDCHAYLRSCQTVNREVLAQESARSNISWQASACTRSLAAARRRAARWLANLEKRFVEGPYDWSAWLGRMKAYQDGADAKAADGKKP